jgi:putative flippase GtrA
MKGLLRRLTGYGASSLVAGPLGELAFAATYGWGHAGTTWASAAGFVVAAGPNYLLNRRWAWSDRRGRTRRSEAALYLAVALASFGAAALGTHWAQGVAHHVTTDAGWRVFLVASAYLAVAGIFFVAKFVCFELFVFKAGSEAATTSSPPPAEIPIHR